MSGVPAVFTYGFMQNALVAAVLVGLTAPAIGTHLVQRRLALIGDGMGHLALTGVALGVLTSGQPVLVALGVTVVGAVVVELVRIRGRTSADMALAVLFYGGIAGGVVIISVAPGGSVASLSSYLFGAITTTSYADLGVLAGLAAVALGLASWLAPRLFAVSNDEEYARASGLPVVRLNLLLAVLTALTVIVAMRIVGLLLVSALMVVPNVTAQLVSRSFRTTVRLAMAIGVATSFAGVVGSFYLGTPSGGTIVLLAIACFGCTILVTAVRDGVSRRLSAAGYGAHAHGAPGHGADGYGADGYGGTRPSQPEGGP